MHLYSVGIHGGRSVKAPLLRLSQSLFTFAMLMLVTANDFMQLFFGWEGVGLASYLLIGFWFYISRPPTPRRSRPSWSIGWVISASRSAS